MGLSLLPGALGSWGAHPPPPGAPGFRFPAPFMAISQGSRSRVNEALGFELCAGIFPDVSVLLECQAPLDVIPLIRKTMGREDRGSLEAGASRDHLGSLADILLSYT